MLDRRAEDSGTVMDNAAGCLGRILSAPSLPVDAIPITNTLAAMLTALPLQNDKNELFSVARGVAAVAAKGDAGWEAIKVTSNKSAEAIGSALVLHANETRKTRKVRQQIHQRNDPKGTTGSRGNSRDHRRCFSQR